MNWLRTILDTVIVCIAFNGVVAFIWILEPKGFSVMLPEEINTLKKEIPKKNMKYVRLMKLILYPILLDSVVMNENEKEQYNEHE